MAEEDAVGDMLGDEPERAPPVPIEPRMRRGEALAQPLRRACDVSRSPGGEQLVVLSVVVSTDDDRTALLSLEHEVEHFVDVEPVREQVPEKHGLVGICCRRERGS